MGFNSGFKGLRFLDRTQLDIDSSARVISLSQGRYLSNTPQIVEANVRVRSWMRTRDPRIKRLQTNVLDNTNNGIDIKRS